MNDNLKQFTLDLATKLKAALVAPENIAFVEKVQKSGDDRTFEVVMSTSDEDRQGDALDQSGWDFKYFNMNPVLLWAHNYQGFPIGIVTDIKIEGDKAVATGKFAPAGINPEADLACALYQEKILVAVSPGYIQNDDGTRELLEVSFCPVPAGRYALSMRQVRSLGMSTRELITKGFFYKTESPPEIKAQAIGDSCEGEDGTPGVLADDPKHPGTMICVPRESKSTETNMNDELTKKLKAEHDRHDETVLKSVDEMDMKSVDEFETKLEGEQQEHNDKCMKAIDDVYDMDPDEKKSVDEFKKAIEGENVEHAKCFDKAIQEFKSDLESGTENQAKSLADFRAKAADELDRHEQAHMDLCEKEFGEAQDDGKDEHKAEEPAPEEIPATEKSGRAISAVNRGKIESIMKSIEEFHAEHTAEHQQFTDKAIAALKELMSSPPGDEGKEDEEKSHTPNEKSSSSGAAINKEVPMSDLDTYLFTQRLLRQVKSASEDGLRQIKDDLKAKFPSRR